MIIHVLFLTVISIAAFIDVSIFSEKKNKEKRLIFFFLVACILLYGNLMSENFGVDYDQYQNNFEWAQKWSVRYIITEMPVITSRGYYFVVHFLAILLNKYYFFKCFVFSVEIICIAFVIYKLSWNPSFALFCYWGLCAPMFFNGVTKQAMAMSISIVASYMLIKKIYINAFFLLIIACFFHGSAVLCWVYFAFVIYEKKMSELRIIILVLFAAFFSKKIIIILAQYYRPGIYENLSSEGGVNLLFFRILILILLCISWKIFYMKHDKVAAFSFNSYVATVCLQFGATVLGVFYRTTYYFSGFIGLFFDRLFMKVNSSNRKFIAIPVILMISVLFLKWGSENPYIVQNFYLF